MSEKCQSYCFTLNNYTNNELDGLIINTYYDYCCFGFEVGKKKGTPHLQGYVEFPKRIRISTIKNEFPEFYRMRLKARKGTQKQAIDYCMKDGEFYEFGTRRVDSQGKRNDLLHIKEMLSSGSTLEEVADAHFGDYVRYNFQKYIDIKKVFNHKECDVMVYRGKDIYQFMKLYKSVYIMDYDMNMYNGQECVIIPTDGLETIVERFCKHIPVDIKYGYEIRSVLPRYVIWGHKYMNSKHKLYEMVEFLDELAVAEKCLGNTGQTFEEEIEFLEDEDLYD